MEIAGNISHDTARVQPIGLRRDPLDLLFNGLAA